MRPPITEIAHLLSIEKFYSTVAKMQKKRMTTPNVWASFRPQNRQEVQIPAIFAVKSWEDQILGARRRCHRTTDKDHAIPAKQGFQPCFFLPFAALPCLAAHVTIISERRKSPVQAPCDTAPHVTQACLNGNMPISGCRTGQSGLLNKLFDEAKTEDFSAKGRASETPYPCAD